MIILCKSTIANFPDESLPAMSSVTKTGVYYGYAQIYRPETREGAVVRGRYQGSPDGHEPRLESFLQE
jgi:hypothetical protein